jgi:hypothetical protein
MVMLTQSQITTAARRARAVVSTVLLSHRNTFTVGWCAAFVQGGRVHVVQRAHVPEERS